MNEEKTTSISARTYLIWTIAIAVIIRIALMIVLQSWEFDGSGSYGHRAGEIGSALASGQGFSWPEKSSYVADDAIRKTAWEAPVYPLIFAAAFKLFGIYSRSSALVLIVFQIVLSAICCLLLFSLGKRLYNEWVGLIGSVIYALYPAGIHFGIQKVQTTCLIVVLLLLFILQVYELANTPTIVKCVLSGTTLGVAVLTDPTLIVFFTSALVWLFFRGQGGCRSRMTNAILILLVAAATNVPWQVRNYYAFGEFFLVKSNFTRELFMGNYGSGTSASEEREYMASMEEGRRNRVYQRKVLRSILSDPGRMARKTVERFVLYWTSFERRTGHKAGSSSLSAKIVGLSYFSVLVFGVAGIFLSLWQRQKVQLLLLGVMLLPIPYYLTWFTRLRYRFPVETIMIVFASYAVYSVWGLFERDTP